MSLDWEDEQVGKTLANPKGDGHQIRFDQALFMTLKRLALIFMTPRPRLNNIPLTKFREANLGFTEVTKYFKELRKGAEMNIEALAKKKNLTLLGEYD